MCSPTQIISQPDLQNNFSKKFSKRSQVLVTHAYILVAWETEIWMITVQGQPQKIVCEMPPTHLQNNQTKTDWRCGSSSRAPALQVQSLEFKPQSPLPHIQRWATGFIGEKEE
jgi:hypothetical protein